MPTSKSRKQPICSGCGHKLTKVGVQETPRGTRDLYGHKKKEHWLARPHKAVPVFEAVSAS